MRFSSGMRLRVVAFACLLAAAAPAAAACETAGLAAFAGRYVPPGWSPEGYVDVRVRDGVLTWGPALWRPARRLVPVGPDAFQIEDFADRRVRFSRDAKGCVAEMATEGLPFERPLVRRDGGPEPPLAVLLGGSVEGAFAGLLDGAGGDPANVVSLGRRMSNVPSQRENARRLARELTARFPASSAAWVFRGDAEIATGRRVSALWSYRAALARDPQNAEARGALDTLGSGKTSPAERALPFTLEAMLREPSRAEVARVRAAWKGSNLAARAVRLEREAELSLSGVAFRARLVAHDVPGGMEYGVVLVPKGARPGSLPVLVEAQGVSWNFSPLSVPDGLNLPGILGADVGRFVLVVPGFRGEEIRLAGEPFRSPSPHESWSGAVEDLLALLDVALATTPEIDPSRVGVFGRSRGGSVALLAAARDPRIRCVVSWAAPADWFRSMAPEGLTQLEAVRDALRRNAGIGERGGQYLDNFLRHARAGQEGLAAVRARLVASSPLYFAESLPPAQLHYGLEDAIVPARNGRAIERRLRGWPAAAGRVVFRYHAGAGHDQDLFDAPRQTRDFLLERLRTPPIY